LKRAGSATREISISGFNKKERENRDEEVGPFGKWSYVIEI
jgi:hypothetical protein